MSTVSRFLVLLFCVAGLLTAQQSSKAPEDDHFFGAPGDRGSFRAGFGGRSAGMLWLQATDHYKTLEDSKHDEHETRDYLLLVNHDQNVALRVSQPPGSAFAKDPSYADWKFEATEGRVAFTLDDGQGLVLV